jgi:arginyl-tRNA--protein-N-Asp/Glu arginylyltransferase
LGYWIEECPKMSYKNQFNPLEIYRDGRWQALSSKGG